MGKMKERLIEDMMRNPELYDGSADIEFWMVCRKEELLERYEAKIKIVKNNKEIYKNELKGPGNKKEGGNL